MADPDPYSRAFSFTDYQTATPQDPLPGQHVDVELDEIAGSVASLVAAVQDVRRSDGKLKNGVVTTDALAAGFSMGFTLRGVWAVGVAYSAGDGVVYNTKFYKAAVAHTASNATRPDLDAVTWTFLTDLLGSVPPDNSVSTAKLVDGAVTFPKLASALVDPNAADATQALPTLAYVRNTPVNQFTRSALLAVSIPFAVTSIRTSGYAANGDGGAALYRRVATQPSHAGKFRSVDRYLPNGTTDATNGGWWEHADATITAHQFGAVGDGVATDTTALQAAIDFATGLGRTLFLLSGTYKTAALTVNRANGGGIMGLGRARIAPSANSVTLFTLSGAAPSTSQKTFRLQNFAVDGTGFTGTVFVSETLPYATVLQDLEVKQLAYGCVFTGGRNVTVRNITQIGSACWLFRGDGTADPVATRIFEVQISNITQQYSGTPGGGVWGGPAFIDLYRAIGVLASNIITESLDDQVDGIAVGGACEGVFGTNTILVRPKIGYKLVQGADGVTPGWCYFTNAAADQPLTSGFDVLGNNLFFTNINSTYGYFDSVPGGSVERQNTGDGFRVRSGATNWHVTNSHITQMAKAGLWIEDGSTGGSVVGSTISGNNLIAGGGYADVINNVASPFAVEFAEGNVIPQWGGSHPRRLVKGASSGFIYQKVGNTQTGNDTIETALASYTFPANTIDDLMVFEVKASGGFAANTNTKSPRIRVAGSEVAIATGAFNGSNWRFDGRIIRNGANMMFEFEVYVGATLYATYNGNNSTTFTGAIQVSVTGQNGTAAAGDIVNSSFDVRLMR